ncbi:hypothetical protein CYMTET_51008 [Cymbomonas tetramitiformis]|uniref:Reverse transcriptase domain-containing protein n=1 Tax=Cymbomonas tetramitiformis TaxID=36881 RepID=A0AAE0BLX9_9CHLO|nr:hypothetical protein CYMTET_51008 [Cymbomonas tetramitiformis]
MDKEIRKEQAAGTIATAKMVWNIQGISAVGVADKEREGVLKFRPVWDYSRPEAVGVNSRIDLEKEKFSSIKDAYAMLRPGLWMAKLGLTSAYRSVPVAAMYRIAYVFEWDEEVLADTRASFGNSAMPGIFMRFTQGIVWWMKAHGASIMVYSDDFPLVGRKRVVLEFLKLLRKFMVFLGFEGNQCTANICEDRIAVVRQKIADIRRQGALLGCHVLRILMEGLLGLVAFCGQVVYGLSQYTRYAHALLAQAKALPPPGGQGRARPEAYIPLLRQLFFVCVQHAVRLRPVYISSEDNIYSDLLSRDWVEFRTMFETDKQKLVWIEGRED